MQQYMPSVIAVVVFAFMALMLAAARRGRPAADPGTGHLLFRHGVLLRGFFFVAAFGVPIGITALITAKPPRSQSEWVAAFVLYVAVAALGGPLLWESVRFTF